LLRSPFDTFGTFGTFDTFIINMNILIPDSWLREYLDTNATVGEIKEYLSLCGPSVEKVTKVGDDWVYDIEITTNRIDMVGIYGICREAAAILPRFGIKATLKSPKFELPPKPSHVLDLKIKDPSRLSHRLMGIVLDNIKLGPSPDYISKRLEIVGIRSLNNAIDITNYVMLELGHPCHVFDYDRIKTNTLILRHAKPAEKLTTLDEMLYTLSNQDIIIDDGTGRIIDLPGILGTANSVVTDTTKRVILFIESNNPAAIRKTSLRLGIRTLAATINEKHPDPYLVKDTILRAIHLFQDITHATVASKLIDIYPNPPKAKKITLKSSFINNRLGISLKNKEIVDIVQSLQFKVTSANEKLTITPPSFRQFDVTIAEDIVEEVARIYGYHLLPTELMTGSIPTSTKPKDLRLEYTVKTMLKYWGYTEVYNYSFVSKELLDTANLDLTTHLKLANPLTVETEYLRRQLIPSLLKNAFENQFRTKHLRFFELAHIYIPQKSQLPKELPKLSLLTSDNFYSLKGILRALFDECTLSIQEKQLDAQNYPFVHPKQSIAMLSKDKMLAFLGVLNPVFQQRFGIKDTVCIAEIDFSSLVTLYQDEKRFSPITSFTGFYEDLTLIVPSHIPYASLAKNIREVSPFVAAIDFLGRFKDRITLQITFRHTTKNLEKEEVAQTREAILSALSKIGVHMA